MTMNLTHAYEMITTPIASSTSATNFLSTYIHMDTTAFDGAVSYYFEIVATNANTTNDYTVLLMDVDGSTNATATVPKSTTTPTRIRVGPFTPTYPGDETYFVKTALTASASNVKVYSARLIIKQVGATKTRVQIPLTTNNYAMTPVTADTAIMTTTSVSYVAITNQYRYALWKYVAANWSVVGNLMFEAVTKSSSASYTASASLNGIANTAVGRAATTVYVTQSTFATSDLADGTAYAVQVKSSSTSGTCSLYQANLYVNLSTITKMEVRQRIHAGISAATTGVATSGQGNRALMDTIDNIASTQVEATGFCTTNGTAINVADMGTVDVSGTPSVLTNSTINFNSGTDAIVTNTLAAVPTVNERLYAESITTAAAKTVGGINLLHIINAITLTNLGAATVTGQSAVSGTLTKTSAAGPFGPTLIAAHSGVIGRLRKPDAYIHVAKDGADGNDGTYLHPYATIAHAISVASAGATIYIETGTYTETGLVISKNLNLKGDGQDLVILDGANTAPPILNIDSNVTVTIDGLQFYRGKATTNAGAIKKDDGTCTITNCSFINNTSITHTTSSFDGYGGAIYNGGGTLHVDGCLFQGNQCSGYDEIYGGGSAIFTDDGTVLTVNNTRFISNTAQSYGTIGIHAATLGTTATLTNNYYNLNTAFEGACVYTSGGQAHTYITGDEFDTNHARQSSGACSVYHAVLTIDNCNFHGNTASAATGVGGKAGCIYVDGQDSVTLPESSLIITNSQFTGNTAVYYGGAIYNYHGSSSINGCTFTSNTAGTSGGAVYNYNGNVLYGDNTLVTNSAPQLGTSTIDSGIWTWRLISTIHGQGAVIGNLTKSGITLKDLGTALIAVHSGVTANLGVKYKTTALIAAHATVAGNLGVRYKTTGLIAAASTVTGTKLSVKMKEAVTIAGQSGVTGALSVKLAVRIGPGTVAVQSGVTAKFGVRFKVAGLIGSQSGVTGNLGVRYKTTALVGGVSTVAGALSVKLAVRIGPATIAATSGVIGHIDIKEKEVGLISAISTVSGRLGVKYKTSVLIAPTSTVTGALKVNKRFTAAISAQSGVVANLGIRYKTIGSITAISGVTANLGIRYKTTALIAAISSVDGELSVKGGFKATIDIDSNVIGVLSVSKKFIGQINVQSHVTGSISDIRPLLGLIHVTSTVNAALSVKKRFTVAIGSISTVIGNLKVQRAVTELQGVINSVSNVSASLGVTKGFKGDIAATSAVTAKASYMISFKGEAKSTSSVSGFIGIVKSFACVISVVSSVISKITVYVHIEALRSIWRMLSAPSNITLITSPSKLRMIKPPPTSFKLQK